MRRIFSVIVLTVFVLNTVLPPDQVHALSTPLPAPQTMVSLSTPMHPPMMTGVQVDLQQPFALEFLMDRGSRHSERPKGVEESRIDPRLTAGGQASPTAQDDELDLQAEYQDLIQYFLASLTTPNDQMWVNLSPHEPDRIVPEVFGETQMARDMLAQDYLLKQITSSLLHPDNEYGAQFWEQVYAEAFERYGTTDIPVETFHKVWIVPDQAEVYETIHSTQDTGHMRSRHSEGALATEESHRDPSPTAQDDKIVAYVTKAKLKVMLEEDYLSHEPSATPGVEQGLSTEVMRSIIIPAIEREVNEGAHFAKLRQIYSAMLMATWFKNKLKHSILAQVYADQNKSQGYMSHVTREEKRGKEEVRHPERPKGVEGSHLDVSTAVNMTIDQIYQQYVASFKEGVYDFVQANSEQLIANSSAHNEVARRYFSGGAVAYDASMISTVTGDKAMKAAKAQQDRIDQVAVQLLHGDTNEPLTSFSASDNAMNSQLFGGIEDEKVKKFLTQFFSVEGGEAESVIRFLKGFRYVHVSWTPITTQAVETLRQEVEDKFKEINQNSLAKLKILVDQKVSRVDDTETAIHLVSDHPNQDLLVLHDFIHTRIKNMERFWKNGSLKNVEALQEFSDLLSGVDRRIREKVSEVFEDRFETNLKNELIGLLGSSMSDEVRAEFHQRWKAISAKYKMLLERVRTDLDGGSGFDLVVVGNQEKTPVEVNPRGDIYMFDITPYQKEGESLRATMLFQFGPTGHMIHFAPASHLSFITRDGPLKISEAIFLKKRMHVQLIGPDGAKRDRFSDIDDVIDRLKKLEFKLWDLQQDVLIREEDLSLNQSEQKEVKESLAKLEPLRGRMFDIYRDQAVGEDGDFEDNFESVHLAKEIGFESPIGWIKWMEDVYPILENLFTKKELPEETVRFLGLDASSLGVKVIGDANESSTSSSASDNAMTSAEDTHLKSGVENILYDAAKKDISLQELTAWAQEIRNNLTSAEAHWPEESVAKIISKASRPLSLKSGSENELPSRQKYVRQLVESDPQQYWKILLYQIIGVVNHFISTFEYHPIEYVDGVGRTFPDLDLIMDNVFLLLDLVEQGHVPLNEDVKLVIAMGVNFNFFPHQDHAKLRKRKRESLLTFPEKLDRQHFNDLLDNLEARDRETMLALFKEIRQRTSDSLTSKQKFFPWRYMSSLFKVEENWGNDDQVFEKLNIDGEFFLSREELSERDRMLWPYLQDPINGEIGFKIDGIYRGVYLHGLDLIIARLEQQSRLSNFLAAVSVFNLFSRFSVSRVFPLRSTQEDKAANAADVPVVKSDGTMVVTRLKDRLRGFMNVVRASLLWNPKRTAPPEPTEEEKLAAAQHVQTLLQDIGVEESRVALFLKEWEENSRVTVVDISNKLSAVHALENFNPDNAKYFWDSVPVNVFKSGDFFTEAPEDVMAMFDAYRWLENYFSKYAIELIVGNGYLTEKQYLDRLVLLFDEAKLNEYISFLGRDDLLGRDVVNRAFEFKSTNFLASWLAQRFVLEDDVWKDLNVYVESVLRRTPNMSRRELYVRLIQQGVHVGNSPIDFNATFEESYRLLLDRGFDQDKLRAMFAHNPSWFVNTLMRMALYRDELDDFIGDGDVDFVSFKQHFPQRPLVDVVLVSEANAFRGLVEGIGASFEHFAMQPIEKPSDILKGMATLTNEDALKRFPGIIQRESTRQDESDRKTLGFVDRPIQAVRTRRLSMFPFKYNMLYSNNPDPRRVMREKMNLGDRQVLMIVSPNNKEAWSVLEKFKSVPKAQRPLIVLAMQEVSLEFKQEMRQMYQQVIVRHSVDDALDGVADADVFAFDTSGEVRRQGDEAFPGFAYVADVFISGVDRNFMELVSLGIPTLFFEGDVLNNAEAHYFFLNAGAIEPVHDDVIAQVNQLFVEPARLINKAESAFDVFHRQYTFPAARLAALSLMVLTLDKRDDPDYAMVGAPEPEAARFRLNLRGLVDGGWERRNFPADVNQQSIIYGKDGFLLKVFIDNPIFGLSSDETFKSHQEYHAKAGHLMPDFVFVEIEMFNGKMARGVVMREIKGNTLLKEITNHLFVDNFERLEALFNRYYDLIEQLSRRGIKTFDLKLENFMVGDHGRLWFVDGGINSMDAKKVEENVGKIQRLMRELDQTGHLENLFQSITGDRRREGYFDRLVRGQNGLDPVKIASISHHELRAVFPKEAVKVLVPDAAMNADGPEASIGKGDARSMFYVDPEDKVFLGSEFFSNPEVRQAINRRVRFHLSSLGHNHEADSFRRLLLFLARQRDYYFDENEIADEEVRSAFQGDLFEASVMDHFYRTLIERDYSFSLFRRRNKDLLIQQQWINQAFALLTGIIAQAYAEVSGHELAYPIDLKDWTFSVYANSMAEKRGLLNEYLDRFESDQRLHHLEQINRFLGDLRRQIQNKKYRDHPNQKAHDIFQRNLAYLLVVCSGGATDVMNDYLHRVVQSFRHWKGQLDADQNQFIETFFKVYEYDRAMNATSESAPNRFQIKLADLKANGWRKLKIPDDLNKQTDIFRNQDFLLKVFKEVPGGPSLGQTRSAYEDYSRRAGDLIPAFEFVEVVDDSGETHEGALMRGIEGGDLGVHLDAAIEEGNMDRFLDLLELYFNLLEQLQERGVVDSDVKYENFILDEEDKLWLVDGGHHGLNKEHLIRFDYNFDLIHEMLVGGLDSRERFDEILLTKRKRVRERWNQGVLAPKPIPVPKIPAQEVLESLPNGSVEVLVADAAMNADGVSVLDALNTVQQLNNVGGIDFNLDWADGAMMGENGPVLAPEQLKSLRQSIGTLRPVIISIQPVANLSLLLGLGERGEDVPGMAAQRPDSKARQDDLNGVS